MTNGCQSTMARPSQLDSGQLWRPALTSALPLDWLSLSLAPHRSTSPSVHVCFFTSLSSGVDTQDTPQSTSCPSNYISESTLQGTQLAEHSLAPFLLHLCFWVPYFLTCWWNLLPIFQQLAWPCVLLFQVFQNLPVQLFSVGLSTRKHLPVTC